MMLVAVAAFVRKKVELMCIHHVAKDHFIGIKLFFTYFFSAFQMHLLLMPGFTIAGIVLLGNGRKGKKQAQQAESQYHRAFEASETHAVP
jgi:hypothetical protein